MIGLRAPRSVPMTMRAVLLTAVLALALAACGSEGEGSAPTGGGNSSTSGERLDGPVKFLVTGGEAFREDRITVQPDGAAHVQTRAGIRTARLTREELDAVVTQIEDAGLPEIPEDSLTKPPMPDALAFSVVYGGRQVSTDSGSMPEELEPLVGTFVRLIDRYGAK